MEADATMRAEPSPGADASPDSEAVFKRLVEVCHDPAIHVWDELDRRMEATVLAALVDVRRRHTELLDEAGIVEEPPSETGRRKAALQAYRWGMTSDVLPALQVVMNRQEPTSMVAGCFASAFARSLEASRGLPESERTRWGEGALDPQPTDTVGRRVRKTLGRWFSVARKTEAERSLQVRALALRHLGRNIVPVYDRLASEAVRSWAQWGARLERACGDWADVALPVLARADVVEVPVSDPETGGSDWDDVSWTALYRAVRALHEA